MEKRWHTPIWNCQIHWIPSDMVLECQSIRTSTLFQSEIGIENLNFYALQLQGTFCIIDFDENGLSADLKQWQKLNSRSIDHGII